MDIEQDKLTSIWLTFGSSNELIHKLVCRMNGYFYSMTTTINRMALDEYVWWVHKWRWNGRRTTALLSCTGSFGNKNSEHVEIMVANKFWTQLIAIYSNMYFIFEMSSIHFRFLFNLFDWNNRIAGRTYKSPFFETAHFYSDHLSELDFTHIERV